MLFAKRKTYQAVFSAKRKTYQALFPAKRKTYRALFSSKSLILGNQGLLLDLAIS